MSKKIVALMLALAMLLAMAACGGTTSSAAPAESTPAESASADEFKATPTYTLRFGHTLTEQDLFHKGYVEWADRVYQATKGDIKIEVYANSQLGVEEDVLEQIRQGANIGWQTDFARAGTYISDMGVMNCPYFLENPAEVEKCQSSATIKGWNDKLASEFGLRPISFSFIQGYRNVYANKEAHSPSEMAGLSIRTANAASWLEPIKSLGCTSVALNYGDIYTGIQTKVVDGCELPYNAAFNLKIQEVCKYILETKHIYQLQLIVVSEDWWSKLPAEYQTILVDECNAVGFEISEELAAAHETSKQAMIDAGMTLIPYEDMDIAAFKESTKASYEALNLSAARDAVYADIGKK